MFCLWHLWAGRDIRWDLGEDGEWILYICVKCGKVKAVKVEKEALNDQNT